MPHIQDGDGNRAMVYFAQFQFLKDSLLYSFVSIALKFLQKIDLIWIEQFKNMINFLDLKYWHMTRYTPILILNC